MSIQKELFARAELIHKALDHFLPEDAPIPSLLLKSMRYSLLAGGKRLRPILLMSGNELLGGNDQEALALACSIEMIHTYSLIHDDLPAMDDDDLRRGKPTNHKVFGEGTAILAGDGLLSFAFELALENAQKYPQNLYNHFVAIQEISRGAGIFGMIAGQSADIESEGKTIDEKELHYIHEHKTGALIKSALLAGLLLNGPTMEQKKALEVYGGRIGLAFQISDDILDIIGDHVHMGKNTGRDIDQEKATFPQLYGLEESKKIIEELIDEGIACLDIFGDRSRFLKDLAYYLGRREI